MGRTLAIVVAVASLLVGCGGQTSILEKDGGSSSSSSGSSGGSSSSSGSSSGGSSGGSSSGSSSGGPVPLNHRPNDDQCLQPAPAGDCTFGGTESQPCKTDSDCASGSNGRCDNDGPIAGCHCTYDACAQDSDCPTGQTCACHGSPYTYGEGNTCVQGNCRVDADCGAHGYCSPADNAMSCGSVLGYYCHTPNDECTNDTDCSPSGTLQVCTYSTSAGHWKCAMAGVCG